MHIGVTSPSNLVETLQSMIGRRQYISYPYWWAQRCTVAEPRIKPQSQSEEMKTYQKQKGMSLLIKVKGLHNVRLIYKESFERKRGLERTSSHKRVQKKDDA